MPTRVGGKYGAAFQAASRKGYAKIAFLLSDNGSHLSNDGAYLLRSVIQLIVLARSRSTRHSPHGGMSEGFECVCSRGSHQWTFKPCGASYVLPSVPIHGCSGIAWRYSKSHSRHCGMSEPFGSGRSHGSHQWTFKPCGALYVLPSVPIRCPQP